MVAEARQSGSARGLVATYSTLGLLHLRLGALPEADAAARVALRVLQEGDFAPGLPFAATVLADVAVEAGELDEAEALLALLPQDGWPVGVGTVLIPAARGRLRLAQGRPAEALADFATCVSMFSVEHWGTEMRDVGYLHARAGAAQALVRLGELERARELAEAELADIRVSERRGHSGSHYERRGLPAAVSRGSSTCPNPWPSSVSSPALLERRTRWPSSVARCAVPEGARPRASRSPRRSTSLPAAAPARSPLACATSSRRPAPARDAMAHRRRGADAERAARRAAGGRRPLEPRDRPRSSTSR